jgi:hypothetical protein
MLAGPGARRLMAGKADAIPLPVAVLPPAIAAALGAQGRVAMLSAATATKQLGKRRPVEAYALAQLALDEGDLWLEHGGTHVAAFIEIDGKLWQVAIKRTLDGREIYLVSLHRADAKNVRRAARAGRKLER